MNEKYPHVELLLDCVLKYQSDPKYDAPSVLAEYLDREINPDSVDDPDAKLLGKELALLLQEPDDVFIAVTGKPGSHDWEWGVPELRDLKEYFSAYIKEIDAYRHK